MDKDRKVVGKIISNMLDNPHPFGVYPMTNACDELEAYIESVRSEMLTWVYTEVSVLTDTHPSLSVVSDLVAQAVKDGLIKPSESA